MKATFKPTYRITGYIFQIAFIVTFTLNSALAMQETPQLLHDLLKYECVACAAQVTRFSKDSLQIDSHNKPHLAYGGDHLYYAHQTPDGWQRSVVDAGNSVGEINALGLDSVDQPMIAYAGAQLRFAYLSGNVWSTETITSTTYTFFKLSMDIDNLGQPHVVTYVDGKRLLYSIKENSAWTTEIVQDGTVSDGQITIVTAGSGTPHISYLQDNGIVYSYKSGGVWNQEIVGYGDHASFVLDTSGYPHFIYISTYPTALVYKFKDSSGWHSEPISIQYPGFNQLALDQGNNIHIAATSSGDLIYANKLGGSWNYETIKTGFFYGVALQVDRENIAHVATYDQSDHGVWYANSSADSWELLSVETASNYRGDTCLIVDPAGGIHATYMLEQLNGGWMYSFHDGSNWEDVMIAPGVSPIDSDMTLDLLGNPHMIHYDFSSMQLIYTYRDSYGWHQVSLAGNIAYNLGMGIAIDMSGNPHIAYEDNGRLIYLSRDRYGWQSQVIDQDGTVGRWADLALDTLGSPHVSYMDYAKGDLKHAYWNGFQWQIEVVDDQGFTGQYSSIAIDDLDQVHIAYQDHSSKYLRYAKLRGGSWNIQTVDNGGDTGYEIELTIDQGGVPHITYLGDINETMSSGVVYYAESTPGGWVTHQITSSGVSNYPGIQIDQSGYLHLLYEYYTFGDILYATNHPFGHLRLLAPGTSPVAQQVQFEAIVPSSEGVSFEWDFGDGEYAAGQVVTHTYTSAGMYTVTLSTTGDQGSLIMSHNILVGLPLFLPTIYTLDS
jgi:hypothetical protein